MMHKNQFSRFSFCMAVSGLVLSFIACTPKQSGSGAQQATTGVSARVVNLAIWSNYISPEQLADFKAKTGIRVQVSNYSSNEELLAKLQAGASGYDVVVPSDYMVFAMSKLALLRELDYSQLPNAKSLDSKFLKKSFDPENKYSVPYDWGTTGIAVNRTLYPGVIKSWKDLFEKEDLAGKFSLLDDAREVLGAALRVFGYSVNSKDPEHWEKAKQLLMKARRRVKSFTSEPLMSLVNGEVAVAQIFMSDALQARKLTDGKVEYLVPEEGGTLWIDNLVVPASAKNIKEAHEFMNFLLEARTNAATVTSIFVGPANKGTFALLPKEFQNNSILFPPPSVLSKSEMMEDLGDFLPKVDRVWTEVKANSH